VLAADRVDTVERVRAWLGYDEISPPLAALVDLDPQADAFALPSQAQAHATLARLDVPPHSIDEIVGAMPAPHTHPEAWWLLERLHHALVDPKSELMPPWPAPWPDEDPFTRYFHLYVFLAAVDNVLRIHAIHGVPTAVTWDTLADLGLQVAHHQARNGRPGFDGAFWMWHHFRGDIFRLGRLQYELLPMPRSGPSFKKGDPALSVHIPALGPLTPEACDASFDRARTFFGTHFPDAQRKVAICRSWLMDDQLADYLPATSNIVRFQRRFELLPGHAPGNGDVQLFVFGRIPSSIDELPQETTLERAVVAHIRSGREWRLRDGWLPL
jgi:hypothetical protein